MAAYHGIDRMAAIHGGDGKVLGQIPNLFRESGCHFALQNRNSRPWHEREVGTDLAEHPPDQQKEMDVRFLHGALALVVGMVGCSSPVFAFSAIGFRAALVNCLNSNLSSPDRIAACNEVIHANVLSSRTRARVIASRGNAWFASTNLGNALDDYNKAIELDPELRAALVNRGVTLFRLGKCEQAMPDFSTVHSYDARSWQALYGRGVCKAKAGDQTGAQSDLAAAAAINPNAAQEFGPVVIARWFQ